MACKCFVCGKGTTTGAQISHSHIRTRRTWKPNLRSVKIVVDGTPKRAKVCTRCLRSGKVQRG